MNTEADGWILRMVTASACAVLVETGPASAGCVAVGRVLVLCTWVEPTLQAWVKCHCVSGVSVVSVQRHVN
jgi:hypothetical protein